MMESGHQGRALLLETVNREGHRHHRAEYFPFLLGLGLAEGLEIRWWVIDVPPETMHAGARYVVDLPPDRRAGLVGELRRWRPEVIVFHDMPADGLERALREALPDVRIESLVALSERCVARGAGQGRPRILDGPAAQLDFGTRVWQARMLLGGEPVGSRDVAGGMELLLDAVAPSYERRYVQEGDGEEGRRREGEGSRLRLAVEHYCPYRRPVRRNPRYRALHDPVTEQHLGCSFCPKYADEFPEFRAPAVERVIRQIRAHQQSAAARAGRFEYTFDDSPFNATLATFFDAVLACEDIAPSVFHTMVRADVLLAQRDELERVLPRLAEAGHALTLRSIGVENFSDAENERLNKGVDAARIWECHALVRDLEQRFPGTFSIFDEGYFATILFTPWTRPEDLRVNIVAARTLGDLFLEKALGTRLQMWRGLAITELARADGLLADEHGEAGELTAVCISSPDVAEIPWRFADPRAGLLCSLLIRLDPVPFTATFGDDDELLARVRAERALLPEELQPDRIELAAALVDAVEELGAVADLAAIFERARALVCERAAEGGDEGDPLDVESAWTLYLLHQIDEQVADRLLGFRPVEHRVETDGEQKVVIVAFERRGQIFRLQLEELRPGAEPWVAGQRYGASHLGELPNDPLDEVQLTRYLLAVFDQCGPPAGFEALAMTA